MNEDQKQIFEDVIEAIENEEWNGIYNAVAPAPVTNSQMMRTIGAISGKGYIPVHVPAVALKIVLGEMSVEVLKSTTVSSSKIEQQGFRFMYPNIGTAIEELQNER